MADQEAKQDEVTKDVLAPAEGPREELIATAVKFLQNPKVSKSPLSQKKAFLERKGLTKDEIDMAVTRSGVSQTETQGPAQDTQGPAQSMVPYQTVAPPLPARLEASPYSSWSKTRDILAVVAMVTGISYAAYRVYQEYLRPVLFGIPSTSKRLEQLEKSLQETLSKVNETLVSVQEALGRQQEKLQMISHDIYSKTGDNSAVSAQSTQNIIEIKSELTSLKGLLLNRRQFPPVPTTSPILPSWQLASSGDTTSKDTVQKDNSVRVSEEKGDNQTKQEQIVTEAVIETASKTNTETEAQETQMEAQLQNEARENQTEATDNENEADVEIEARDSEREAVSQNEAEKVQSAQYSEVIAKLHDDSDGSLG